jgi:hypothetical protein
MKRPCLALWVGLLISLPLCNACQSSKSEEQAAASAAEQPVAARSPALAQAEALAQRFGPIMAGAWVNAEYLAMVQRTRSPRQAYESTGSISEIHLNPSERVADSLVVGVGFGNHEGGSITLYLRPGQHPAALPTSYRHYDQPGSFSELSYHLGPDTTLLLTIYSKTRKVLERASYQRISRRAQSDGATALTYAVNHLLFAGSYAGTDSLGRPVRMQFTADGQVKGLKGFRHYAATTDFGGGPGNDIDCIELDPRTKHGRPMGYQHRGDTLRLYGATLVGEQRVPGTTDEYTLPVLTRGRLLFTLLRR